MKGNHLPIRIISIVVILYMIFALSWWAILLSKKNKEVHDLKVSNIKQEELDLSVQEVASKYDSQQKMIYGEGLVFGLALVLGIWLINRSYRQEIKNTTNQNNFLMAVTHELRSPIASSKLVFETFIKRDLDKEKISELSKNGLMEIERLESNVEKILFTTKMENEYPLYIEDVDIGTLVKNIKKELEPQFPDTTIISEADTLIKGDKECMQIIIHNLIENSLKYSDPRSEVKVSTQVGEGSAVIKVIDSGIGIPKEEQSKVLEKFYRIGKESTRRSKGTGLGLYLVHQMVKAHHGTITIGENKPQGTIVTIVIPQKSA